MSDGPARKPNLLRRAWQWFWRGDALVEVMRTSVVTSPRTRELYRRARLADELGRRTLDATLGRRPLHAAHAAEFFRQAVTWILCALDEAGEAKNGPQSPATLEELWAGPARGQLAGVIGDPLVLSAAEPLVLGGSFVRYAELPEPERRETAQSLRVFVRRLFAAVEVEQARFDKIYRRRALHVGLVLFAAVALFMLLTIGSERQERRRDLAAGRPWKASSHLMGGCTSPAQSCTESPLFFFHTQEDERPWIVIDLGTKARFSSVRIQNRIDCCPDRGLPLVVEVSNDQKKWKQVARRNDEYDVWKPQFEPQTARWVRVRAMTKTWLHLHSIRVLP